MNHKQKKKLQLDRQTVAVLSAADQKLVNGGVIVTTSKYHTGCDHVDSCGFTGCNLTERISARICQ